MSDATGQTELDALHEARLRSIEEKQDNAAKWLEVLIGQVRMLRQHLGLPADFPGPPEVDGFT